MHATVKWRSQNRESWAQSGGGRRDHAIIGYKNMGTYTAAVALCGAARIPPCRVEVAYRPDRSRCCATCWQLAESPQILLQPCPVCSRMVESYPNGKLRYHTLKFRVPCPGACEKP